MKKIIITGATGFIGSYLSSFLAKAGYKVIGVSRKPGKTKQGIRLVDWDKGLNKEIKDAYAVINLAGENVASGLWTKKKKERIFNSRVNSAMAVKQALFAVKNKTVCFIQISATGYYGNRKDEKLTEVSKQGKGFLADVCAAWEKAARLPKDSKIRSCVARTGVVMGSGSFLSRVSLPFKFFMGGNLGNGKQYISWIHIFDLARAILFLIENKKVSGIHNFTSPVPVTNRGFSKSLGKAMNRPCWFAIPSFAIKLLMGEMGEQTALASTRVIPGKLVKEGFKFTFEDIGLAISDVLYNRKT